MEIILKGLQDELPVVDEIIYMHGTSAQDAKILIPDNKAEIIIPLQHEIKMKLIDRVRSIKISKHCFFLMPRRRGVEVYLPQDAECLILKINPIYTRKFTEGMKEVAQGTYHMPLHGSAISKITDAFVKADHWLASQAIIEALGIQTCMTELNEMIIESILQITEAHGDIRVKEIYSSMQVSKSKLELHFNREIGLTPKEFCKIEKINRFIRSYFQEEHSSLTELTYHCGYYDQSHLIKDFKYFLDTSPRKYFSSLA